MANTIHEVTSLTPELAGLLASWYPTDVPPSIVTPPVTAGRLIEQAAVADTFVIQYDAAGAPAGWGTLRCWREDDLTMYLVDGFVRPTARSTGIGTAILRHLERAAATSGATDRGRAMIGGNAGADDSDRRKLLTDNGYEHVLTVMEMRLDRASRPTGTSPPGMSPPDGLTIRPATPADALDLHAMMLRVWAGRAYFRAPSAESYQHWLAGADLELFHVAEIDSTAVGYVASNRLADGRAEIDDVLVDLPFQRRGIAAQLIRHNLSVLAHRGDPEVRLQTEGHDPAGALSLYRRLGFVTELEHLRYRKPLAPN